MKFVALVSSGIDSPVAAYLLAQTTDEMILVHADNRPFTDEREMHHFILLAKHLKAHLPCNVKAYSVPHGQALAVYKEHADHHFTCVFCKRMMVRYAEMIAKKEHAWAIVMGDSLGQVASQTLQNISVVDQTVTIPILRPLIGLDKEEIIQLAKEFGTYELSILPTNGCSAVPSKPSTRAKREQILVEEKKFDVSELVKSIISEASLVVL